MEWITAFVWNDVEYEEAVRYISKRLIQSQQQQQSTEQESNVSVGEMKSKLFLQSLPIAKWLKSYCTIMRSIMRKWYPLLLM